jgi:hypothetical protein
MLPAGLFAAGDRQEIASNIDLVVDHLFSLGDRDAGDLAVCWMMMTADPQRPSTFSRFMPQLGRMLSHSEDEDVKARLEVWWRAAAGEMVESKVSIFMIADTDVDGPMKPISNRGFTSLMRRPPPLPNTVIVMPTAPDTLQQAWKPLLGDRPRKAEATPPVSGDRECRR